MKKILIVFLLFTGMVKAQIINIPDASFKAQLLASSAINPIATDGNAKGIIVDNNANGEIEISEALSVIGLNVSGSKISNLVGIEKFTELTNLDCSNNSFKTLDISNLFNLVTFKCDNSFTFLELFLKNGQNDILKNYSFSGNPNLQYICVDEFEKKSIKTKATAYGYTNCVVNSYCTFTPGGNYYTLKGKVRFDDNSDGCDALDSSFENFKINTIESPLVAVIKGSTFTNKVGDYIYYSQNPDLEIVPSLENPTYFNIDPVVQTINFTGKKNIITQDFCITANGIHNDLEIVLSPVIAARPGFDATYQLVYKNKGNQIVSGDLKLSFNDGIINLISASPVVTNQVNNLLTWNYTNLQPFETRIIDLKIYVNSPSQTPAVNVGDILNFTATINPTATDDLPDDNTFNYNQKIVSSLVTNTITCLEGDAYTAKPNDYFHYKIDFENIGDQIANDVIIETELDTTQFDLQTLQILNSTNGVKVSLKGNFLTFIFDGIYLKVASGNPKSGGGTGGVLMKISPNNSLTTGSTINNNATIFFNYDTPVFTNTASTVYNNSTLNTLDFKIDSSILIYPNPTKGKIDIVADTNLKSIQLFDIQGRIVQIKKQDKNSTSIDISNSSKGIYFLKITTDKGSKVEKIIKE
jgi:hypothetical protein